MANINLYWVCDRKSKETMPAATTVSGLRNHIQDKLLQDYDLSEDPDVKLICNGNVLEDDSAELQHAGIAEGSVVHALSVLVAETNGERKKITSMKEVFDDLKETGARSTTETAAALKEAQPFDLCCSIVDLGELGEGIPILFNFICLLILVLFGLFLIHIPSLVVFAAGDGLEKWTEVQNNETLPYWYFTAANLGPDGSSTTVCAWVSLISGIMMLLAGTLFTQKIRQTKKLVDQTEVDVSDFGLFVEGLPHDLVDAEFLKQWMEQNLRDVPTEIVQVVIGYNMIAFKNDKKEFLDLRRQIAECEDATEKASLQARYTEYNKRFADEKAFFEKLGGSGTAIVLCRYSKDQNEIIQSWNSCQEQLAHACDCCTGGFAFLSSKPPLSHNGEDHLLTISRACLPSDMLWENLGIRFEEKWKARAKIWCIMFGIFLVGFMIILGGRLLQQLFPGNAFFLLAGGLLVGFTIVSIFMLSKKRVDEERWETKTRLDFSLVFKYAVTYFVAFCIALPAASLPAEVEWYASQGLITLISLILVLSAFMYCLFYATGCKVCFARNLKKCISSSSGGPQTQAALNKIHEPADLDIAKVYGQVLKIYVIAIFFTPVFPIGALIASIGLIAFYWSLKKFLLRDCKRPYRQSADMGYYSIKLFFCGTIVFAVSQWWLLSYSLKDAGKQECLLFALIIGIAGLCFVLLHRRVYTAIFCTFLCFPAGDTPDHGDIDYYDAQKAWAKHQKYHTSHDVYLWLENIYLQKQLKLGQTPPWDLKTGNLPKPGEAAVPDAPALDTAGPKAGSLGLTSSDPTKGDSVEEAKEEGEEEDTAPDETAALAEADPAELALEEMKYKITVAAFGGGTGGDTTDEEVISESEDDEDRVGMLADLGKGLKPGTKAIVSGLEDAKAAEAYDGTSCTVIKYVESADKYLCELEDGKKATLPASKLTPEAPPLAPGTKMRIHGLTQGTQFNDTECTIISFNKEQKKYCVELFTGQKVYLKSWNLHEPDDVPDLS